MLALAAGVAIAFGIGLIVRPVPPRAKGPSELEQVRTVLADQYYERLSPEVLASPTIPKLISALRDRYTTYLTLSLIHI